METTDLRKNRRKFAPDETRLIAGDARRQRSHMAERAAAALAERKRAHGGLVQRKRERNPGEALAVPVATEHRHRARHFVRHLLEMILAMIIGMAALGAIWRAILAACGVDASAFRLHHVALVALVMAVDMTVPMVWWMRHRGHNWARGAEMAGAMFVPTLLLIGLLQLDAVSGDSLIGLEHALMLPAMLLVMFWRLDEYTRPHAQHAH
jgi:flagellar biosynthetic protein FliP